MWSVVIEYMKLYTIEFQGPADWYQATTKCFGNICKVLSESVFYFLSKG